MKRTLCSAMAFLMVITSSGSAWAGLVATGQAAAGRPELAAKLEGLGVDQMSAAERVAAMTDDEVAQVLARLDQVPAGGEVVIWGAAGLVLLVIVFIIIFGTRDNPAPR